jgi:flagellar biogenesis protein FliO
VKVLIAFAFSFLFVCSLLATTPATQSTQAATTIPATPSTPSTPVNGTSNAVATETAPAAQALAKVAEPQMEEFRFPILQTIGGLGVVLFLIAAGFFTVKKFAPQYFLKGSSEKSLKVIETLSMGDKRSISIIQVANSRFLVGNTVHQINLLTALPEKFSLVSEPDAPLIENKKEIVKEPRSHFRNLFEVEKIRPIQQTGHPLPEDLRTKMRQLREALERG